MDDREKLLAAIAALQAQRGVADGAVIDAALDALRQKLAAVDAQGKSLRQVTVLFLDVVGSTALSRELDPEDINEIVDGALKRLTAVVLAHKGKVLQYAGDSILAVFGADRAQEDDPVRAVKCGLALVQEAQEIRVRVRTRTSGNEFNVRVGIHTGPVLLGGGVDEASSIRGIAVNVAARMEQAAPPGAVRISHETERHVHELFDVSEEQPLTVKGFEQPIRSHLVWRLRDSLGQPTRGLDGVYTPIVGRQAELERLGAQFQRARAEGSAVVAIVTAEPGVGKSRLAREVEARLDLQGVGPPLRARAQPYSESVPYGLVRDLVLRSFDILDSDGMSIAVGKLKQGLESTSRDVKAESVAALARLIGFEVHDGLDARRPAEGVEARNQAFATLTDHIRSVANAGTAALLVIDDLHWSDEGSLEFIEHLVSASGAVPLMVLCLTRPEFWERKPGWLPTAARIELAPLERAGSRQLVDALLARMQEVPHALRDLVTTTAEGNPYFIEELIGVLVEDGVIQVDGSVWRAVPERLSTVRVPTTLTGVLQARLDALPSRQRTTLQRASVVGHVFWDDALRQVEPEVSPDLQELVRRDLAHGREPSVFEGSREYAFKHHLLHAVTYQGVLKDDKRRLHRVTAEWLLSRNKERSSEYHGLVADHFEKAGEVETAIVYLRKAGRDAWRAYALQSALAFFDRAVALLADGEDRFYAMLERAEASFDTRNAGTEDRCISALEAMAEALDDDAKRAIAASVRTSHLAGQQNREQTGAAALKALAFAERSGHVPSAIRAHNQWGFALCAAGDLAQAQLHAEEGLSLSRKTSNVRGQANALSLLALVAEAKGEYVLALAYREEAIPCFAEEPDKVWKEWAICRAAVIGLLLGDHDGAVQRLRGAHDAIVSIGSKGHAHDAAAQLARAARATGQWADVFEWTARAGGLEGADADISLVPDLLLHCGDAHAALGRLDEARDCYRRCVALYESWNKPVETLDGRCGLARVALATGDTEHAMAHVGGAAQRILGGWRGAGCTNPSDVMLATFEVLKQVGDPRAGDVLAAAHSMLMDQAARLGPVASTKYLQAVTANRRICELWRDSRDSTRA
jgi:class 3 adenylate cyclase/tetratricopeptide (TPR) repeat protein